MLRYNARLLRTARSMKPAHAILSKMPPVLVIGAGLLLMAAVAFVDTVTGPELAFYVFYFAPIALVAWFAGRWPGIFLAACSAAAWILSFIASGGHFSSPVILWWNTVIRLISFCIIALLTSALGKEYAEAHTNSRTDFLTGVLNKRAFDEVGEAERLRCLRYEHPLSIAYFDVDNFKKINDEQGHDTGDRLLKLVARTVRQSLRRTDTVARVGGDEFVVLLPEAGFAAAEHVLEKLRQAVLKELAAESWPATLSVGAAVYPVPSDPLPQMVECADELMYSVKRAGRNSIKMLLVDESAGQPAQK